MGCEAARSPDDLDSPRLRGLFGCGGVWLVLPDAAWRECVGGVGVGLFLENCIVDASIL